MKNHALPRLVSVFLALLPLGAQGQEANREGIIAGLEAGQRVRLDVEGLGRVEGRFLMADEAAITFAVGEPIRLPDIERLWVRGRSTGRGAWIGAAIGLAAGIIIGLDYAGGVCHDDDGTFCSDAKIAAGSGAAFGAGGAVLGAGIGFAIPTWRLRFP